MHIPTIYSEEYSGQEVFEMTKEKSHHLFNVLRSTKYFKNSSSSNGKAVVLFLVIKGLYFFWVNLYCNKFLNCYIMIPSIKKRNSLKINLWKRVFLNIIIRI